MPAPTMPPMTTMVASNGPRARLKSASCRSSRLAPRASRLALRVSRAHHDPLDAQVGRAVRDAVDLRRLPFGVAAGAVHFPLLRPGQRVEVAPKVGGDRVVGDVGHHASLLAVL